MKHRADKTVDLERMREALALPEEVPGAVEEKLRALYRELPEELPVRRRGAAAGRRGFALAAASMAAAFLLLFGTNLAFPAFAESLPVVGRVFENLNRSPWSYVGKTAEGTNLGSYAEPLDLSAASQGSELTVLSAYSDGESLSLSVKLTVPQSVREQVSGYFLAQDLGISVDGTLLTTDVNRLILDDDYQDAYLGTVTLKLPEKAEDGQELKIALHAAQLAGKGKMTKDFMDGPVPLEGDFGLDFTVTVNSGNNVSFSAQAQDEGAKVLAVKSLPTLTKITVTLPDWKLREGSGWYSVEPLLYLTDGTKVQFNLSKSIEDGGYYPWGDLGQEQTCDLYFDGVPAGTEQMVLRFTQDGEATSFTGLFAPAPRQTRVRAEFTIDLKNGMVQASRHWEEEGALNLDSPFDYVYLTAHRPYDESKLENGLYVNGLMFDNREKWWSLGVITDQPYRPLKAQLVTADGTVQEEEVSVNEPTNATYISGFYDERTSYYKEGRPYSYTIAFHNVHYQPACGETITVRLLDGESGELLAEQEIQMNEKSE